MKQIEISLIIIGKICSGKSFLAKQINKELNFPIASFGNYLLDYSKKNHLQPDRESLQNLGVSLIQKDHKNFLNEVINFVNGDKKYLIFEGVRHKVIFEEIQKISNKTISIYLDVDVQERLSRFLNREKEIDQFVTQNDFYLRDQHIVEKEVDELRTKSSYIIASTDKIVNILKDTEEIKSNLKL